MISINARPSGSGKNILDLAFDSAARSVALIGPNGAGKSTLLRGIQGLLAEPICTHAFGNTKLLLQRPVLLARSVSQQFQAIGIMQPEPWLAAMDLSSVADRAALTLSTGQQQRLALALILSTEPDLLLLDEPTASLDVQNTLRLEALLRTYLEQGGHLIMATHSFSQARRLSDETWVLFDGKLVRQSASATVFSAHPNPLINHYLQGITQ